MCGSRCSAPQLESFPGAQLKRDEHTHFHWHRHFINDFVDHFSLVQFPYALRNTTGRGRNVTSRESRVLSNDPRVMISEKAGRARAAKSCGHSCVCDM